LLVKPKDRAALLSIQDEFAAMPNVSVALTGQTLRRVADQLASGGRLLKLIVTGVGLLTFLALLLAVYSTSLTQTREVAVMRVLGARRFELVGVVLIVTLVLIVSGTIGGLALGQLLGNAAQDVLRHEMGLHATVSVLSTATVGHAAFTAAILALVGIQPAAAAYRLQAAEALNELPGSGRSTRSQLRYSLRFFIPLAIFIIAQWMISQHSSEVKPTPLEPQSAALFKQLSRKHDAAQLVKLDGQKRTIEGYMYAIDDPYVVEDFYLVGLNPHLPRCPFCYRAPTKRERILVRSAGRQNDLTAGLVRVAGILRIELDAADPYQLELSAFEVVIP